MDLGKAAHGMNFGWHKRAGAGYRIGLTSHGGDFERIDSVDQVTDEICIKFGNNFDRTWIHPNQIPHSNWYFWDNPEIPQLLNPNPANPRGLKTFVRLPRGLFTTQQNSQPSTARLDAVLSDLAPGTTVENLVRPVPVRTKNSRKVLLCPSSAPNYRYYYGTTRADWLYRWKTWCEHNGFEAVVRTKPDRPRRVSEPESRLYDHLVLHDYFCTISQHSVAAVESIMAGTPSVVTGPHPAGYLATDQKEFVLGQLRIPDAVEVWNWISRLASNTYHKKELFKGTWRR